MSDDPLIHHRYTVLEIERMRKAVFEADWTTRWVTAYSGITQGPLDYDKKDDWIERQVRTYMLNGTRPEELEAVACTWREEAEAQRRLLEESTHAYPVFTHHRQGLRPCASKTSKRRRFGSPFPALMAGLISPSIRASRR